MTGCRPMSDFRLVLVGWGAIATRVADLLAQRRAPVRLVAVAVRDAGIARDGLPRDARLIDQPEAVADLSPDLVVEAAGRASVLPWGRAALSCGASFAPSSTSVFADDGALEQLLELAAAHGGKLIIPPGALGGIDALAAAARLPLTSVLHEVVKPPAAWAGTPAAGLCNLSGMTTAVTFYRGSARAAARDFPQNANVVAISALAGLGLDQTEVALVADPAATRNLHRVTAEGDFGRMQITLENRPLATNPKSSEMTALSLVRMIENLASPLVI